MQDKNLTVRLAALDGTWEVGGVDRKAGIVPENTQLTSDLWGSATASFDMRRDPRAIWPDLGAYTPVEFEEDGEIIWSGRIASTPTRDSTDRVISVQAVGWQYHLDDDLYERTYVHTRVSDWRDARTFPTADLTVYTAAPQISSDNGILTLADPANVVFQDGTSAAVGLDLGPVSTAKRLVVTYDSANPTGNTSVQLRVWTSVSGIGAGATLQAFSGIPTGPTTGTVLAVTPGTGAFRYIWFGLYNASGTNLTPATDIYVRVTSIQVFAETTYESGNASILKASDVITDALSRATVLLNTDRSGISATSFAIPDFGLGAPGTPREAWSAVNAYHDYLAQIDVSKRPVFRAKPILPMFEVGAWSPLELQDQSANSGDDIYNRVIVTGTGPDGSPLRAETIAQPQLGTAVGMAKQTVVAANTASLNYTGGSFIAGTAYTTSVLLEWHGSAFSGTLTFGTVADNTSVVVRSGTATVFNVTWTPASTVAASLVTATFTRSGATITLSSNDPTTLIGRRGFYRTKTLPVSSALTPQTALQIGGLWLNAHKTTPYKGSFKLTGDQAVRDPTTGAFLPLGQLLLHTGELIRDTAAIDPDTGGIGRDGRIAQVTYTPATGDAVVTLDNSRASFEALLARFDVLSSVGA